MCICDKENTVRQIARNIHFSNILGKTRIFFEWAFAVLLSITLEWTGI